MNTARRDLTARSPIARPLPSRRTVLRATGGTLSVAVLGRPLLVQAPAYATWEDKPVINTYKDFDGHNVVAPFGYPDTTTYGQTIVVPAQQHQITSFTFYMIGKADKGQSIVVRGEVYGWDGSHATTKVAQSRAITLAFDNADVNEVEFGFGDNVVEPGEQYVIFASIDKDYKASKGEYAVTWGAVDGSAYPDGDLVFQNDAGKEADWTSASWTPVPRYVAATKVFMAE